MKNNEIYIKYFGKNPIQIDNTAYTLLSEDIYDGLKPRQIDDPNYAFIDNYYWESWIINKINNNSEGYFDFSKDCIDIGSNIYVYGMYTNFNYYHCFEPNHLYSCIGEFNMLLHDKFDKFKTYNVFLSKNKNDIVKYTGFKGYENEEDIKDINDINNCENIITHTLDEYSLDNIGFIKIDVEGFEENVLRGGIGTIIRNNYPPILFELWDVDLWYMTQEKHDSLQKFLEDLGYNIFWYWGDWETHLAIHKSQLK